MILHYSHCHWYIRQRHDIRYVTWFEGVFDHLTSHYPYCHWYIKQRHVIWHIAWFWRTCICLIFIKKKIRDVKLSSLSLIRWRRQIVRHGAWFGRVSDHMTSHYPHCHWYIRQRHVMWHVAWFWRMSDHVTCI